MLPVFSQGCMVSLEHFLSEHLIILGAVGLGLCCLQVRVFVFERVVVLSLQSALNNSNYFGKLVQRVLCGLPCAMLYIDHLSWITVM
jgi:hypothetical protein